MTFGRCDVGTLGRQDVGMLGRWDEERSDYRMGIPVLSTYVACVKLMLGRLHARHVRPASEPRRSDG